MRCQTCQKEFEPKRKTAKYCSAKCRKLAFQEVSVPEKIVESGNAKINIVPKDEWRRDYLEEHAEFFLRRYEETKDCPKCNSIREQFKSEFMFCPNDLLFPKYES